MVTAISWLLAAAALAFVGWPLFSARVGGGVREPDSLSPLERQKVDAYAAIKEAEFDKRMGKLSDEDYKHLDRELRGEAVDILKKLDRLQPPKQD